MLAKKLEHYRGGDAIVLALPRGGVPVGFMLAGALKLPLDILLVRKIGAPGNPEVGLGAIVDGPDPQPFLNEDLLLRSGATDAHIEAEKARELAVMASRRRRYRGDRPALALKGRTVIIVDDGIATGGTVEAVLQALNGMGVAHRILAVPVAPPDVLERLKDQTDEIVCLLAPKDFRAVGLHYADFAQISDDEVIELLTSAGMSA